MIDGSGEFRVYQNFWCACCCEHNTTVHTQASLHQDFAGFLCRFHAQRFYALHCLATREANATAIKGDMSLNMMAIEMPVAKAVDFYQHVQVKLCICSMNQQRPSLKCSQSFIAQAALMYKQSLMPWLFR